MLQGSVVLVMLSPCKVSTARRTSLWELNTLLLSMVAGCSREYPWTAYAWTAWLQPTQPEPITATIGWLGVNTQCAYTLGYNGVHIYTDDGDLFTIAITLPSIQTVLCRTSASLTGTSLLTRLVNKNNNKAAPHPLVIWSHQTWAIVQFIG